MENYNAITCLTWVPRGASKHDPEKVEITEEELSRIIAETKDDVEIAEDEIDEEAYTNLETEYLAQDSGIELPKKSTKSQSHEVEDKEMKDMPDSDEEDLEKKYGFSTYDDTAEPELLLKLGKLTVHAKNKDDPYIKQNDGENSDSGSDIENQKIMSTDNLVVAGHVEGDAAILDIYVYNSEEICLYVHHDVLLPAVPLCMEWLNFNPDLEDSTHGNFLAIGCLSPVIEVYDLDMVNCIEPVFKLGRKAKKKKKQPGIGHTDAVLALAWNKDLHHIMASGSVDETVILWDIQEYKVAQTITSFKDRIQALQWHPKESHGLLTGSCDKYVRMFDCRTEDTYKSWKLDGEIEALSWDVTMSQPFCCYVATDTGHLYCIDARKDEPLWEIKAHSSSCTSVALSSKCPGCLVTVSEDQLIKIWDVSPPKPQIILEKDPKLGIIHTVSASPDDPFVFSFGGDRSSSNFKVWDIRGSKAVRERFCPRIGLPVDPEGEDDKDASEDEESEDEYEKMEAEDFRISSNGEKIKNKTKSKPDHPPKKKKPKKKRGDHLDKKK